MSLSRALAASLLAVLLGSAAPALAQEEPEGGDATTPGVTGEAAPRPTEELPTLQADPDERRAMRGRPLDEPKVDPLLDEVERFERDAFRDGQVAPFGDDEVPLPAPSPTPEGAPPADLAPHAARGAGARAAAPARPVDPWLQGLEVGDLPVRWDPRVVRYLKYYKDDPRGHKIMAAWLARMGKWEPLIREALRRHGLPQDLIYLCMIESAFDPTTRSRVGAAGLWQFMPGVGKGYGLRVDHWVDERQDPVKGTEAAMLYWRDVYERFGSWHLALAAYNAGFGAVLKSIAKYNTNDFWALLELESGLPWESSVYVSKAIAASIVGHNRQAFGFADVVNQAPAEWDVVEVERSSTLAQIARAAGVSTDAVTALNPALRRGRTPPDGKTQVRVPKGRRAAFLAAWPATRGTTDVATYVLRHGERFEDVAKTFGMSPQGLRELNGVTDQSELGGGTTILVPAIDAAARERNRAAADTDLYRSEVAPGDRSDPMIVAVPDKTFTVPGKKRVFYRVVPGDTLEGAARVLGVLPAELARENGLDPDAAIQPRMVLLAWVDPRFDAAAAGVKLLDESRLVLVTAGSPEHMDVYELRKGRVRKTIVVKAGDTLESLGKKHHLSQYDVARINRRSYTTPLVPGEELVLYVIQDKVKARAAGVYEQRRPGRAHKTKHGRSTAKSKSKGKRKR